MHVLHFLYPLTEILHRVALHIIGKYVFLSTGYDETPIRHIKGLKALDWWYMKYSQDRTMILLVILKKKKKRKIGHIVMFQMILTHFIFGHLIY